MEHYACSQSIEAQSSDINMRYYNVTSAIADAVHVGSGASAYAHAVANVAVSIARGTKN